MNRHIPIPTQTMPTSHATLNLERLNRRFIKLLLAGCGIGVLLFLAIPVLIVIPMSFSEASSLRFPPQGFSLRWYVQVFTDASWISAMRTSLVLALAAS